MILLHYPPVKGEVYIETFFFANANGNKPSGSPGLVPGLRRRRTSGIHVPVRERQGFVCEHIVIYFELGSISDISIEYISESVRRKFTIDNGNLPK